MLRNVDYRYFEKARQIANISDYNRIHVGCVAVYHGQIIGIGCNTNKTHPAQKFSQIKNLDINFSKVKLYIYRIRKDQPFGLARPCPSCMAAIKDLGIRDVYYTTNDGYAYEKLEKNKVGGVA